jgi:hypothetical protein
MGKLQALAGALIAVGCIGLAQAQVRPEVGKPLQQAGEMLRSGKAREALAKVREADAVANKTAAEQLTIERMRAAAAQRAGDSGTAIAALESIFGRVSGSEAGQVAEQLAFSYSQARDYAKAGQWANRAQQLGGGSAQLRQLQSYLLSQSGDYGAIAREAAAAVAAAEAAGRKPDEGDLLRLADAQQRGGNSAGQSAALDKLVAYYPKKEYWSLLLGRLPRKSGFSDRFALDVLRLRLATGTLTKPDDYMEMTQMALLSGLSAEGKAVVEKGFAAGVLGTGAEGERHKRLRDLAIKQDAEARAALDQQIAEANTDKSGDALVQTGFALVTMGQAEKGLPMIERGIAKGGLKRPEDARLRLGIALLQSGKNKAKAVQTLRSLQGTDGVADLGRLWAIVANQL